MTAPWTATVPSAPMAAPYAIRIVGDPVLRQRANEVTDINGKAGAKYACISMPF